MSLCSEAGWDESLGAAQQLKSFRSQGYTDLSVQSCVHNLENDNQQISYCGGLEAAANRASEGRAIHEG